jgi:hypothetical protein
MSLSLAQNTATAAPAVIHSTAEATQVTAQTSGSFFGRIATKFKEFGALVKAIALKVAATIKDFFVNFPTYAKTGYFVGIASAVALIGGMVAAQVGLKDYPVARTIISIVLGVGLVASGAIMLAYGKNTAFARTAAAA